MEKSIPNKKIPQGEVILAKVLLYGEIIPKYVLFYKEINSKISLLYDDSEFNNSLCFGKICYKLYFCFSRTNVYWSLIGHDVEFMDTNYQNEIKTKSHIVVNKLYESTKRNGWLTMLKLMWFPAQI